jgi:hypothetical protein
LLLFVCRAVAPVNLIGPTQTQGVMDKRVHVLIGQAARPAAHRRFNSSGNFFFA